MTKEEQKEYQRKYYADRYAYRKSHGICVRCGRKKAASGITMCLDCRDIVNLHAMQRRDRMPEEKREKERRRVVESIMRSRRRREAQGLCVTCGKKMPEGSTRKSCPSCLAKGRRWQNAKYARTRKKIRENKPGICRFCDEPVLPGKKVCQIHYERFTKGRDKRNNDNHPWRDQEKISYAERMEKREGKE